MANMDIDKLLKDVKVVWWTEENGHGYKVISFNTFHFSVAWRTAQGQRIETPARSILVTL